MCDNWMRPLRLPLSHADFLELPRNPAYRYQYADGVASITPMPRYYHCRLDLTRGPASDGQTRNWGGLVRPLAEGDWAKLPRLFAESFHEVEPFAGLNELGTEYAGRVALDHTRTGDDGPLIPSACFIAENASGLVGAALTTLLPLRDPTAWNGYYWSGTPPEDAVATRQGRPHLTWIFVRSPDAAHGIGTALFQAQCRQLRDLGFGELLSTFIEGNATSMLWHWRMGFTLLQNPESHRRTTRAYDS